MQNINVPYEIIIGEDCSTDNTFEILEHYKKKYPQLITIIHSTTNVGAMNNFLRTIKACKGKYIAFCEGDDYWIDNNKLQKQFNFLEQHKQYSLCSTRFFELNENIKYETKQYGSYSYHDIIVSNPFGTLTTMIRKNILKNELYNFLEGQKFADWPMWLFSLINYNGYIINDITAVYRHHNNGIFTSLSSYKRALSLYNLTLSIINHTIYKNSTEEEKSLTMRDKIRSLVKTSNVGHKNDIRIIIQDSIYLTQYEKNILLLIIPINYKLFIYLSKKLLKG